MASSIPPVEFGPGLKGMKKSQRPEESKQGENLALEANEECTVPGVLTPAPNILTNSYVMGYSISLFCNTCHFLIKWSHMLRCPIGCGPIGSSGALIFKRQRVFFFSSSLTVTCKTTILINKLNSILCFSKLILEIDIPLLFFYSFPSFTFYTNTYGLPKCISTSFV